MLIEGSFDLTNGAVLMRIICALFFIPHMYFKAMGNPPPAIEFFTKAGYKNPMLVMRIALVVELIASTALFLNIYTQYVALMCAGMLAVAAVSIYFANDKKFIWLWPKGGKEYAVFWCLSCIAVSMLYWR